MFAIVVLTRYCGCCYFLNHVKQQPLLWIPDWNPWSLSALVWPDNNDNEEEGPSMFVTCNVCFPHTHCQHCSASPSSASAVPGVDLCLFVVHSMETSFADFAETIFHFIPCHGTVESFFASFRKYFTFYSGNVYYF